MAKPNPIKEVEIAHARDLYGLKGLGFRKIGETLKPTRDHKTIMGWHRKAKGTDQDWDVYRAMVARKRIEAERRQRLGQDPQDPQIPQLEAPISAEEAAAQLLAEQRQALIDQLLQEQEQEHRFNLKQIKDVKAYAMQQWDEVEVTVDGQKTKVRKPNYSLLKCARITIDLIQLAGKEESRLYTQLMPAEAFAEDVNEGDSLNTFEDYVEEARKTRETKHPTLGESDQLTDFVKGLEAKGEGSPEPGEEADAPLVDEPDDAEPEEEDVEDADAEADGLDEEEDEDEDDEEEEDEDEDENDSEEDESDL